MGNYMVRVHKVLWEMVCQKRVVCSFAAKYCCSDIKKYLTVIAFHIMCPYSLCGVKRSTLPFSAVTSLFKMIHKDCKALCWHRGSEQKLIWTGSILLADRSLHRLLRIRGEQTLKPKCRLWVASVFYLTGKRWSVQYFV
jgi:hypothetical protein